MYQMHFMRFVTVEPCKHMTLGRKIRKSYRVRKKIVITAPYRYVVPHFGICPILKWCCTILEFQNGAPVLKWCCTILEHLFLHLKIFKKNKMDYVCSQVYSHDLYNIQKAHIIK